MLDIKMKIEYRRDLMAFLERLDGLLYNNKCACCGKKMPNMILFADVGYLCRKCYNRVMYIPGEPPWVTPKSVAVAHFRLEQEREVSRKANKQWRKINGDRHFYTP